uniref:ARAD1D51106p n=1 Tax=Blastobotrys adeninivorans TaxID=409370 RepID=A0A060TEC4_BLAAD
MPQTLGSGEGTKKRVRTGCLTCRAKHRRCDETHPVCKYCASKKLSCEWPQKSKSFINTFVVPTTTDSPPLRATVKDDELKRQLKRKSEHLRRADTEPILSPPKAYRFSFSPPSQSNDSSDIGQLAEKDAVASEEQGAGQPSLSSPGFSEASSYNDQHNQFSLDSLASVSGSVDETAGYSPLFDTLRDYMLFNATVNDSVVDSRPPDNLTSTPNNIDTLVTAAEEHDREEHIQQLLQTGNPKYSTPWSPSEEDKMTLFKNYIDVVAPWLDMFDHKRHFTTAVPKMSKDSLPLFYSILAVSSRQLERVDPTYQAEHTFKLYEMSLHHLAPTVRQTSISTVTSCVLLGVFEMILSTPKTWRSHLVGSTTLFKSMGIHGFSEPLNRALFWCYARMDVAHAVIEEGTTVCPSQDWIPSYCSLQDAKFLFIKPGSHYEMYANYAVFLCSRVVNVVFSDIEDGFEKQWQEIWDELEEWRKNRPPDMHPCFYHESDENPFPKILFTNGPAISGNQLYHMAYILMAQNKPRRAKTSLQGHKSLIWHAKQIIAISLWNDDPGCLNNALQPIWIAGRLLSSKEEHEIVASLLKRIELKTGWSMKWRLQDLRKYWQ